MGTFKEELEQAQGYKHGSVNDLTTWDLDTLVSNAVRQGVEMTLKEIETRSGRVGNLPIFGNGVKSIAKLFGVSLRTATRLRDNQLAPACTKLDKSVIVNLSQAVEIMNNLNKQQLC